MGLWPVKVAFISLVGKEGIVGTDSATVLCRSSFAEGNSPLSVVAKCADETLLYEYGTYEL